MLYIVSAMDEEIDALQYELEVSGAAGNLGFPVEFHVLGVGPARAGEAMAKAINGGKRKPQGILMLGVAGAVEPGLETGELVLSRSYVRQQDADSSFRGNDGADPASGAAGAIAPDPALLEVAEAAAAEALMPVRRDSSLTVDHLVSDTRERQRLREAYSVATVNMEDHGVAAAARDADVPFLSARVVLDTAEQRLPGYLPKLYRSRNAIVGEVLARPWRIPTLRRLKSQMELCRSVLARFGMSFLRQEAERRREEREKATAAAIY